MNTRIILNHDTLTVAELKKELESYPDEMPVIVTWEGTYSEILLDDVGAERVIINDKEVTCLVIDAD